MRTLFAVLDSGERIPIRHVGPDEDVAPYLADMRALGQRLLTGRRMVDLVMDR